jgi:hypothetical protein
MTVEQIIPDLPRSMAGLLAGKTTSERSHHDRLVVGARSRYQFYNMVEFASEEVQPMRLRQRGSKVERCEGDSDGGD